MRQDNTYHAALITCTLSFPYSEVLLHLHLHFSIVVFISVDLVSKALLSALLVIHGVLGLVDRVGLWDALHGCCLTLLTDVQSHLGDVLDFSMHVLLMVRWR